MTATPAWAKPVHALADFVTQKGRLPRQSGADNDVEIKAGNVLRRMRQLDAQGTMPADLRSWLDENIPTWKSENTRPAARGMRGSRTFAGQVRRIALFRKRHRRMPSSTSPVQRERELGVFLVNHRQAAKGKGTTAWSEAKREHLDRVLPGWDRRGRTMVAAEMSTAIHAQKVAIGL